MPQWLLISSFLVVTLGSVGLTQEADNSISESAEPPPGASASEVSDDFDHDLYQKCFEEVWSTIKNTHWDPEVYGEKWDAAKLKFQPKMDAAKSNREAIQVLTDLVDSLEQSHFGIIPARSYAAIAKGEKRGGPGYSGLTVRWVEEGFAITLVEPGSPASAAGLKAGWTLLKIQRNDKEAIEVDELLQEVREATEDSVMRTDTALGLAGTSVTSANIGDELKLTLGTPEGQIEKTIKLAKGPGKPAKLGNLPTTYVRFSYKPLGDEIGYIKFNAYLDPVRLITEYEKALKSPESKSGLIIDLRGNMGGMVILPMGMAGWMVEDKVALGTMEMRGTPLKLALNPRKPRYTGKVAVLIDECTISASEIMSGGLKDLGLARVFGTKSAGLVLPSTVAKLPSGDGFQYAMAGYTSASGRELEVNGVIPDEEISLTRSTLLSGKDPVVEAALSWLKTGSEK